MRFTSIRKLSLFEHRQQHTTLGLMFMSIPELIFCLKVGSIVQIMNWATAREKKKTAFSLIFYSITLYFCRYNDTLTQFSREFSKRFAETQTINQGMYKQKVEFYHHYIFLGPWPTYMKINTGRLVPKIYVEVKFEVNRPDNNREIDP